jgi:hypothetical protein
MAIEKVNTDFNVLNAFEFIDNVNLIVNQESEFNTSLKAVPSFGDFMRELVTKLPSNFNKEQLKSIVIVNKQYAKLNSSFPKGKILKRGLIYEYIVPYNQLDLVLLDKVIMEIKTGQRPFPPKENL